MKNVFLLGNGFDLHHKLPTKYFDFICVAKYLTSNSLSDPINVGTIFSKCKESKNIAECYELHRQAFDSINVDFSKAVRITQLLNDNLWFDYFIKTLNIDLGWIDFEKEISTVIQCLDMIISENDVTVHIPSNDLIAAFVLSNFRYFLDVSHKDSIYAGNRYDIKDAFLKERIHNSRVYGANKMAIFEELYSQLQDFNEALNIYLCCFVENALDIIRDDDYTRKCTINLLNLADSCVTFNYTSTLEKMFSDKKVFHIHGMAKLDNLVLGVNPNESDDINTDNTSLIKFKKYYQREVKGTDKEYVNWYRETINQEKEFRVIVIGHSLDETDKDILTDMFQHAKEIYVTYYNEKCRDDYINNIIRIFGNSGFDSFKKKKGMLFISLLNIDYLFDKIKPVELKWEASWDRNEGEIEAIIRI